MSGKNEWWAHNATTLGYATRRVTPGSVILYREHYEDKTQGIRLARVLEEAKHDGAGAPYEKTMLRVLACDDRLHHVFERHIELDDVMECYYPLGEHAEFAAWFLSPNFLQGRTSRWSPDQACEMARAGSLTDRFLKRAVQVHLEVSPRPHSEVLQSLRDRLEMSKELPPLRCPFCWEPYSPGHCEKGNDAHAICRNEQCRYHDEPLPIEDVEGAAINQKGGRCDL